MQAAMQREGCLKRRNKSIPLARLFSPCSQSRQTCSFVLGFIPLIGEPGCPLSGLVHARCSQRHGWYDSLALTDFLPGQSWILGQSWRDGFKCQQQPMSDSWKWTHLTGDYISVFIWVFLFLQIKQLHAHRPIHYFRCSICCTTLTHT